MVYGLEDTVRRMLQVQSQIRSIYSQLEAAGFAPDGDGFSVTPPGAGSELTDQLTSLKTLVETLKSDVGALHESGCMVKDIDSGLVDWYAKKDGRDVLLCWKLGEKEVSFWHELEAGFAGRQPISSL